jgi:hypothetical protein
LSVAISLELGESPTELVFEIGFVSFLVKITVVISPLFAKENDF